MVLGGSILAACTSKPKPTEPDPASALQLATGFPATFAARATITPAPVIQLVDVDGDPVSSAGISILATLSAGSGSLQGTVSVATTASGQATFSNLNIAGLVGTKAITFSSPGLTSVAANGLTLTVGVLASATANSTVSQSALTSAAVATLPSVLVTDADGNSIQGQAVTFAITAGGGALTGADQVTNAGGIATVGSWTTGGSAGTNTMTATVDAQPAVTFNVSAAPAGVAVELQLLTAPPATVASRATLTPAPVIQLRDAAQDPVTTAGIAVTVALTGGGALSGTASVNTDGSGQATFTGLSIAGLVGNRTLQFSSAGMVGIQSGNINLTAGPAANLVASSTTTQNGTIGQAVLSLPSVRVTDLDGNGVQGTPVIFTLTGGGGTIGGATSNTGANGSASLGSWTLGPAAGANTVDAAGNAVTLAGAPITFTVNATASASQFTIDLDFRTTTTPAQQAAFTNAKARWQTAVTGDITDFNVSGAPACEGVTSTGIVDDVKILVFLEPIDGAGKVLGAAGPCIIRSSSRLTVIGVMRFDTADLPNLEANGSLDDVILHEMGHVLGYGTLWDQPQFNFLTGACTPDPRFTGSNAVAAYTGSNGGSGTSVGVEDFQPDAECNNGTRDSHWEKDSVTATIPGFGVEVMTGFISQNVFRPLSLTSIQSLKDLGYVTNPAAADPFDIRNASIRVSQATAGPPVELKDDILNMPIYSVDEQGRVTLYRDRR